MNVLNFREGVFTQEELNLLSLIVKNGNIKQMMEIYMDKFPTLMSPEKEIEIQKLKNHYEPQYSGYENKVKKCLEELETREHLRIETPEQEQKIQILMDEEKKLILEKNKLLQKKLEFEGMKTESEEKGTEVTNMLKDISSLIKEIDKKLKDIDAEEVKKVLKPIVMKKEKTELLKKEDNSQVEDTKEDLSEEDIRSIEISRLQVKLDELEIEYDKRWGKKRLEELLNSTLAEKENVSDQPPNSTSNF